MHYQVASALVDGKRLGVIYPHSARHFDGGNQRENKRNAYQGNSIVAAPRFLFMSQDLNIMVTARVIVICPGSNPGIGIRATV